MKSVLFFLTLVSLQAFASNKYCDYKIPMMVLPAYATSVEYKNFKIVDPSYENQTRFQLTYTAKVTQFVLWGVQAQTAALVPTEKPNEQNILQTQLVNVEKAAVLKGSFVDGKCTSPVMAAILPPSKEVDLTFSSVFTVPHGTKDKPNTVRIEILGSDKEWRGSQSVAKTFYLTLDSKTYELEDGTSNGLAIYTSGSLR